MIVHHAHGLHERITDRRTNEIEAATLEIAAKQIRFQRMSLGRRAAFALDSSSLDELPDIFIETAKLFLDIKECFGVPNGRIDLQAIADDAGVAKQLLNPALIVFRHNAGFELVEGRAVVFALPQDCLPTQAGLGAFKNQEFEQRPIIACGHAPFGVVIGNG